MNRTFSEHHFTSHDGQKLYYASWQTDPASTDPHPLPTGALQEPPPRKALILLHRGHEHSGRVAHWVDHLNNTDWDFYAWDARGHGRNEGPRGFSTSFGCSVKDLDCFYQHLISHHKLAPENIAIVAQSVGSALAATWVHDYAPKLAGMVVAAPAFDIRLYLPFAKAGLKLLQKIRGNFYVNSYVKARFLTHDPARIESYNNDPLITRPIAVNVLLGLYQAAKRVVKDAGAITIPTQVLVSGSDFVVRKKPQYKFYQNLSSQKKEIHEFAGFYHDTLGEAESHKAFKRIRQFLEECFSLQTVQPNWQVADREGYTFEEFRTLSETLPTSSLKARYYKTTRQALRFGSRYSQGLQTGFETGFDSGSMLDYVYKNVARGSDGLVGQTFGKTIDRVYLDSPGWAGIRQRKLNLQTAIGQAFSALKEQQKPLNVLDIAAGHGRYVLDALMQSGLRADNVCLHDYSQINVEAGREEIQKRQLQEYVCLEQADAFDETSIASTQPQPTLGIVSGLYELFPDNAGVVRSLRGLAAAIEAGGYLIYTNQPWHPQLELIARALTSHRDNQPWIMRRRTQAEMDALVQQAGFEKCEQWIDEEGIFTVSLARRLAH